MKISDILRAREKGFAFEFFPPKTDSAKESFMATLEVLKKFNPLYMTMTYGASGKTRENTKAAVDILQITAEHGVNNRQSRNQGHA